jgi:hypothetical protein
MEVTATEMVAKRHILNNHGQTQFGYSQHVHRAPITGSTKSGPDIIAVQRPSYGMKSKPQINKTLFSIPAPTDGQKEGVERKPSR